MSSTGNKQEEKIWVDAWYDALAGVCVHQNCMSFANLNLGGDDFKLIVAQSKDNPIMRSPSAVPSHRIRVYKGTNVIQTIDLLEEPIAIETFYADGKSPRVPFVAVASGCHVYFYQNYTPHHRFTLPSFSVSDKEQVVWNGLKGDSMDTKTAVNSLIQIAQKNVKLTKRSEEMLSLVGTDRIEDVERFIQERKNLPLLQISTITCMSKLSKAKTGDDPISSIVLGTESNEVLVLDPYGVKIVSRVSLKGTPSTIRCVGYQDLEYRIIVATRDGSIYQITNGKLSGIVIKLESQLTDVLCDDKMIFVGTMNKNIHCFSRKGTKQYTIYLPSPIKCMETLVLEGQGNLKCLIVALENHELRIYNRDGLVNTIQTLDRVVGMCFGTYGTEPNTLALSYANGGLEFKFVNRRAKLESSSKSGIPPEQLIPIKLPPKTSLYTHQTEREKEYATEMHRRFQKDLCKLRLTTAKAFVKVLTDGQGPLSHTTGTQLRLNAIVQGLGPLFKIKLTIQNGGNQALHNIPIMFQYNQDLYHLDKSLIMLPSIVPGVQYHYSVTVNNIDEGGNADSLYIIVVNPKATVPLITAVVDFQPSQGLV